jgi:hypothetical protein
MMRVSWFANGALIMAAGVGFHAKAYACSCQIAPREKDFEASAAVFEGQVTAITSNKEASGRPGEIARVRLNVIQSWKGLQTEQVTVLTPASASECGYSFQMGKSYLIYAAATKGEEFAVSSCSRTRDIADAQDDIRAMGTGVVTVDPKLTPEEKKAYSTPVSSRQKPAGCASCQVGAGGGSYPRTIFVIWLAAGVSGGRFLRRRLKGAGGVCK